MRRINQYSFSTAIVLALCGGTHPANAQQFEMQGSRFNLENNTNSEIQKSRIGGTTAYWEDIIAQNTCETADIKMHLANTDSRAICERGDLNCYRHIGLEQMATCLSRGVPCDDFIDENDLYVRCLLHPITPFQQRVIFHNTQRYDHDWHNSVHGWSDQKFVEQLIRDLAQLVLDDFDDRDALLTHQSLSLPDRGKLEEAFAALDAYTAFEPEYPQRGAVLGDRSLAHQLFMTELSQKVVGHVTTLYGFSDMVRGDDRS